MRNERIIRRKWGERRKGKTDWAAVDALTDKQIEEAVRDDPDAVPLDIDWSKAVLVIPPKKKAMNETRTCSTPVVSGKMPTPMTPQAESAARPPMRRERLM